MIGEKVILNRKILIVIASVFVCLFLFSRSSWGMLFPNYIFNGIMVFFCLASVFSIEAVSSKISISTLLFIIMFLIFLTNNHDIINLGIAGSNVYSWVYSFIILISFSKTNKWINHTNIIIMCFSVFYAVMTIFCNINTSFYYNTVYPLFRTEASDLWFTAHPSAGFTSNYSVNSCYIAIGLLAYTIKMIDPRTSKKTIDWIAIIILLLGLLMAGKRGVLIAVIGAITVSYINITSNDKRNRFFKPIIVCLIGIVVLLFVSQFVPSINYMFQRFVEKAEVGDVTSGRTQYWSFAWEHIKEEPIFGHGWRWFKYNNSIDVVSDLHNTFLQLFLETGIVGVIVFFSFFIYQLVRIIKLSRYAVKNRMLFSDSDILSIYFSLIFQVYYMILIEMGAGFYSQTQFILYFMVCSITEYYYLKGYVKKG